MSRPVERDVTPSGDTGTELQRRVALGGRILAAAGHTDLDLGHVSARVPDRAAAWIKPLGVGLEEARPVDLLLLDWDGHVLDGTGTPHIEWPIHGEIYRARPDVGAVVHTHPEASLAFAATGHELRPLSHDGALVVPPDLPRFTRTSDLIRDEELGADLARSLGDRSAMLIPGHGVVTVGANVAEAVVTAASLERACRIQLAAMAAGGVQHWTPDAEALDKRVSCWPPKLFERAFTYLVRTLPPGLQLADEPADPAET